MLMTAAPWLMASAMPSAEDWQVMIFGSGTLSARAPGHTPTMPRWLTGAAATDAVAVPCSLVIGQRLIVVMLLPWNSGCVWLSWASTRAIRGLEGVRTGGVSA